MSKKKLPKVLVLGNFGFANHDLSGQTIKTRVTFELIDKYYEGSKQYFDTQTLCKKSNIFKLLNRVIHCDKLVYLPAHGNLKYLFPLYFVLSNIFKFDIIYSVIGGWLVPYLKDKPMHRWMLKHIYRILAETTKMKTDLESAYRFSNVDVLYNFRFTNFKPQIIDHQSLRLVFMARIDPNKGLDTIFNFCRYISELSPLPSITVDFYGPFSPFITEQEFMDEINKYPFVKYHGPLEPENITDSIHDYDLLMLPTHYYTEGLPGTIIDSYIAGLPVVVSNWMHASEFVENDVTGIIVPFENNQKDFNESIMNLYNSPEKLHEIKQGAMDFAIRFTDKYAWDKLVKYLEVMNNV